ncbi:phage tail sheath family protein [Pseudobacteroides cellulosolvens]|uniref:Phage tail sheath protein n=1 Tax=Pseudobacteroides cellulosolvens ATCC 35603 = DSM 2933 TaxID=398512 RepID=A0A0L6JKL4_9FIRM|nr:phage tail sheath family protein [Pseudobacteroides cellulosolvens]KNY26324.1 hypothetical protein Bccel_1586 [Pseudobacteroides cellulosolvens ATCC 35603 = DSM 2933]
MAGGTWATQNKVRPGVYVNFKSIPDSLGNVSDRGICALPLIMDWGAEATVTEVNIEANFFKLFGYDLFNSNLYSYATATTPTSELFYVREALRNAKTVYVYRLNTGTKATKTFGTLVVTAKYSGLRGNNISIAIQQNIDDNTKFDVITYVDSVEQDRQSLVSTVANLKANDWVVFSGTGNLTVSAGTLLAGGANGTVTSTNHTNFTSAIEIVDFNTVGYIGDDSDIKAVYKAFVARLRDTEGRKIQAVLYNYASANYEGIISIKNDAKLVAWTAGAVAGANVNQSLTYRKYDGDVPVNPTYTNSQIITALNAGEFVFTKNASGEVIVEQDINTFVSFTSEKGKEFRKNKVIRTLDAIAVDAKKIYENFYIGKVNNDANGRNLLKNELITYMKTLQSLNGIQNFDAKTDIEVLAGEESDAVVINLYAQPVDAVEKIYVIVNIA